MSGDAMPAVEHLEAENRFDSDHEQTSLHHDNADAEIHSENGDIGTMSQLGQPTELRNGNEPTESTSNGREPRSRWITETEWTHYIQEDPHCPRLRIRQPSDVSIFRVPKLLKDTKKEAYVPLRVSLGPYHHGSAELPSMGHHKGRALRRMIKGFLCNLNVMDFANYAMEEILGLENEIRDNYEENFDCDRHTLARMLCLDGCFILEALKSFAVDEDRAGECYDPIFGKMKLDCAAQEVVYDILILENQVPFIVLQKLLEFRLKSGRVISNARINLDAVATYMAGFLLPFEDKNLDIKQGSCNHRHLLDFMHAAIASPPLNEDKRIDEGERIISIGCCSRQGINDTKRIPHAVELRNAGIKFSALQEGCIKQIMFDENSATIFLPPISIMDPTERVFRNLMAYEMCKTSVIDYVSCYVSLMDDLIDSEQDVALLRRMGVLKNWLGSDQEVVDLFNGLAKEVAVNEEHVFDNLAEKVNAHYNNEMKVQIGKLMHDHFSSPWNALALTAAILILLLTVLQTIFTIISTYKK